MSSDGATPRSGPSKGVTKKRSAPTAVGWFDGMLPVGIALVVSIVVIAGLAILPARTWLSQRNARAEADQELISVQGQVAELQAQLNLLQTDAEVERMARENFDLVYPGEESYRILPAPDSTATPEG